jgi:aspartate/methionine/tyrosine aminotransferase/methylase of polypeptide subunit release factors
MATYPATARAAYEQLQALSSRLSDPATRDLARAELRALADLAATRPENAPLRLAVVHVAVGARQERLELLLLPSIFAPEEWAFTFLEGLLEVPLDEYEGKRLVEVGSGSGWICIALARFTQLARLVGLDLNPQAAAVATCNAWLNGDEAMLARLSFDTSDLIDALAPDERWDFIVGCIPQVLRSEGQPSAAPELAGDEQALYDLSNYTTLQNVYEDSFGLGLIARLLDEAPERFAPAGRCVLNLAGRPGRAIIERMFSRRGFAAEVLFARRVMQAADTDIRPLVDLERRTRREFEFYLEAHSPEPIRAETALGLLEAGQPAAQPIWHEVAVWQARLRLPRETLALRRALRAMQAEKLLADLDLSSASQEQLDLVASLAQRLADTPYLPYAHEAGDASFRAGVARYLRRFFDLALDPAEIFVAPEREQAIYALLLATCDPGDRVLVSRNVHAVCAPALTKAGVHATITNNTLREVGRLLEVFDVKMVLLAVEPEERSNLAALRDILDACERRGILVVIDESAYFRITSGVEPRTLFEFLAREPHRTHLVVLYGLIKNAVFADLELSLLLPVPARLHADLAMAAEVTYSRIGTLPQWLYERLFADLLSFRISFGPPPPPPRPLADVPMPRSRRMAALSEMPAFAPKVFREDDPELIRLDYGENEVALPLPLIEGLIAACAAPAGADGQHVLAAAIASLLLESRGVRYTPGEIVLGQGVWPLVHDLGVALAARLGRPPRVFVATPCYALLAPTLAASGCVVEARPLASLYARRDATPGPTPDAAGAPDVIVVSQPSNPAGTYLTHEELVALSNYVVERRALLVSDEIFGLLDLTSPATETVPSPVTLEQAVPGIGARTLVLGGLSKELAAGGLRVGWMALRDTELAEQLRGVALGRVHLVAARTAAHVYGAWRRSAGGRLAHPARHRALREYLAAMRRDLAAKHQLAASAFPPPAEREVRNAGGLFLAPDVSAWLGCRAGDEVLTPENLARVIYEATHVVVNDGAWCGDPERVRVVFSVPQDRLERAVARLRAFAQSLRRAAT